MGNCELGAKLVYKEKELGDDVLISGLKDLVELSDEFFIEAFVNTERRTFEIKSDMEFVREIFRLREISKSDYIDWNVVAGKKTDDLDNVISWVNKALSLVSRSYEIKLSYHTKGVDCNIMGSSDDVVFLDITKARKHVIVSMLLGKFKEKLQALDGFAKDYIKELIEFSTHIGKSTGKYLKNAKEGALFKIKKGLEIEMLVSSTDKGEEIEKVVSDMVRENPVFDVQRFLQRHTVEYLKGLTP